MVKKITYISLLSKLKNGEQIVLFVDKKYSVLAKYLFNDQCPCCVDTFFLFLSYRNGEIEVQWDDMISANDYLKVNAL